MKKVGFIGHREIKHEALLELKLIKLIQSLLPEIESFHFGSNSQFNDLCWQVVSQFQDDGTKFRMINFYCGNEHPILKEKRIDGKQYFDEIILPQKTKISGKRLYIERNKALIDTSDIMVFYYNSNYSPQHSNSGTRIAYEYAKSKNKTIINLFK